VTTRKPKPAHSEEELLEQWDFLARVVERQAAQLRAGIQDAEEADEPAVGLAEVDGLRRDLDRLRAELRSAEAARVRAAEEARQSREALTALTAAQQQRLSEAQVMRRRDQALEREASGWRERAAAAERERTTLDEQARVVVADLTSRIGAAEASRRQAERRLADAAAALDAARVEIESLREQLAAEQHGFWRFGRR
jgi:vacuolar-type H+-ATPase subunit I/STV1